MYLILSVTWRNHFTLPSELSDGLMQGDQRGDVDSCKKVIWLQGMKNSDRLK